MAWAVLDTSVYIGHWERGRYEKELADVRSAFVIRHSAVVLSELRRGARTPATRRLVEGLFRFARLLGGRLPAEAGRLNLRLGDVRSWGTAKRRDFQNDALIALTARRHGATVVTANRGDFDLLSHETGVRVLPV